MSVASAGPDRLAHAIPRRGRTAGWEAQRRRTTLVLLAAPLFVMLVLYILPLLYLADLSVSSSTGLSLEGYRELLRPVYGRLMLFTLKLGLGVTVVCLLLGYPLAYLLAHIEARVTRWIMVALLIALWSSILARTYSWIIILQRNGVINDLLVGSGLSDQPLSLVYNEFGVYVGMVHILMPFMILTLVPSLKAIDQTLIRSALSLGATPWRAFRRVYLPLSMPGVVAGSILCFTMAIGFFITPAILGGGRAKTIVMAIKDQVQLLVDLRLAGATSMVLLALSILILVVYERIAGVDRLFGGGR